MLLRCLSVAANAGFSVAGLVLYVAALVFTVAGTVCTITTRCFMCPHCVLCCRNGVFCCCNPEGTHEGSDVTSRCFVLPDLLAVSTCGPTGGERKLQGRKVIEVTSPHKLSSPLVLLISACILIFHLIVTYLTSFHFILSRHISSCRTFCFFILFCYYLPSADIFFVSHPI